MLDLLLSAGGGGVLGLVGAGFKSFMGWKEKKLTLQHELDLARETRLTMGVEIQLAKLQGEIELEQTEVTADASNLNAALQAEASITGTSQWVTDLRGSTRPVLTYLLSISAVSMVWNYPDNPWNNDLVFMAMTAVGYWFGDRPKR